MSASLQPSGRASRSEVRTLSSASEPTAVGPSQPIRQNSFSGRSRRLSNSGRETPITGERSVNRIMGNLNLSIKQTPAGMMGLHIGSAQSELEALQNETEDEVNKETKKLKNMESRGKTPLNNINKQKSRVKKAENKLTEVKSAIEKVTESKRPKRSRNNKAKVKPLKRTKSAEDVTPSKFAIKPKPPPAALKPTLVPPAPPVPESKVTKGGPPPPPKKNVKNPNRNNLIASLKRTLAARPKGRENVVETTTENNTSRNTMKGTKPVRRSLEPTLNQITNQNSSNTKSQNVQTGTQPQKGNASNTNPQTSSRTPTNQGIPKRNNPPPIKEEHRAAKGKGSEERAKERRERWEREGPPAVIRALEPVFNRIAKQKNTPPGITKTNLERLLQPFKQPVTVTVAPTISVKGGSAKATGGSLQQTQIQYKTPANKKKKPLKLIRSPETMRKEKSAAFRKEIISKLRSPAATKRRETLYSLRTPTVGQRKTHVIQLIDRVLRRMKAPKDAEKKLIKFYEGLSEKQIKSLFGGRSPEFVKNTLKKQIDYLKKKKR
jgi:hypothetical protein